MTRIVAGSARGMQAAVERVDVLLAGAESGVEHLAQAAEHAGVREHLARRRALAAEREHARGEQDGHVQP